MVTACRINDREVDEAEARILFCTLSDVRRLSATGGFLYKARFDEDVSYIGVVPVIDGAARNYHYEIPLGSDQWPFVTGAFYPDGSVQALCLPRRRQELSAADRFEMRVQIEKFCSFALRYGYSAEGKFDWITVNWFSETAVFDNVPISIGEVVSAQQLRSVDGS